MNLADAETYAGIRNFGIWEFGGNSVRLGFETYAKIRERSESTLEVLTDLPPPSISPTRF
jgi:hypothetical protein